MMENLALGVCVILHELFEFGHKPVGLAEIKGSKIGKEWFVYEILYHRRSVRWEGVLKFYIIDVEEECIGLVLGGILIGYPVKFIYLKLV